MTAFPFRIVGFDLDGTLIDTAGDLTAAVNHALALVGRAPLTEAEVRPMIGLGARHMLEQGLAATGGVPEGEVERLYPELLSYYGAHIAVHSRPFPGLTAALDRLDAIGVRTAVVTNKAEGLARKLLGEFGLSRPHGRDRRRRHARARQPQAVARTDPRDDRPVRRRRSGVRRRQHL